MRVVVQRVAQAAVEVAGKEVARIGKGLLVLVGFRPGDSEADLQWMARKLLGLRIFEDAAGKMNVSVQEIGGEILLVPQFTLYADCRKGRRPGFNEALAPDQAEGLFQQFCEICTERGGHAPRGIFGAHMYVSLINDGPVTIIIDSPYAEGMSANATQT